MNIITTQFTLKYRSFEVVVAGCKGDNGVHCAECYSPETWNFKQGSNYTEWLKSIKEKLTTFNELIDWIWVYGGEPLDQEINDLERLLHYLKGFNKPIMLFTRKDITAVPASILSLCDYIKSGKYDCALTDDNYYQMANGYRIQLATINQKIIKVR